jgi:hypothetical protein
LPLTVTFSTDANGPEQSGVAPGEKGPAKAKVMNPVGLYPSDNVAVSLTVVPTVAVAGVGVVIMAGVAWLAAACSAPQPGVQQLPA